MLPSLANQVHVSLTSAQVALVAVSGVRRTVLKQHRKGLSLSDKGWDTVIQGLDQVLAEAKESHGHLHITVGSEFVRYLTLPAQQEALTRTDQIGYAKAAMQEVYGTIVSEWEVQCDEVPPGIPMAAIAIDKALITAIQALAEKYELKLRSIQPFMARAMNRLQKQVGDLDGMLGLVEETRVLILQLQNGYCQQIRQHLRSDNWDVDLSAWLMREQMLADEDNHQVLLYAPTHKNQTIQLQQPWQLTRVSLPSQLNANYAMLEAAI